MDEKKSRIEKIYSRNKIKLPKIKYIGTGIRVKDKKTKDKQRKIAKITDIFLTQTFCQFT